MKLWLKELSLFLLGAISLIAVIVAVVIGLLIFNLRTIIFERDHVADEILIQNLQRDLGKYELLISMFEEDIPAQVIHPDRIRPDAVIGKDRWEEYRVLFAELGLDSGMGLLSDDSIWFISTSQGLVTGGSTKGYVFRPSNPFPQYPNLDKIPMGLKSNVTGYRKINDEWYITFSWDD